MIGISINKFKIKLSTTSGDYGFECKFHSGLNIIRGNNSSGKSTFINSLIYSLGMEELIGGKGIKVLPYALKDYVESADKDKIRIASSYVYIEITNRDGKTMTRYFFLQKFSHIRIIGVSSLLTPPHTNHAY